MIPIHANTIALYGPAALILLACAWGFARILYLNRVQGVSVLAFFGRKRSAAEKWLVGVALVLDAYLLIRPLYPATDLMVFAAPSPVPHWGVGLMALGIAIAVLSQVTMGAAWRIGVPAVREHGQELITGGLYRFSRNPIYVGIMLFILGSVITVPGPITILSLVLSWPLIGAIIQAEEEFLTASFGDAFTDYKSRVRRWL